MLYAVIIDLVTVDDDIEHGVLRAGVCRGSGSRLRWMAASK